MDQHATQPGMRTIRVAEPWQGFPDPDQGLLDRILGECAIVQDQGGCRVEAIDPSRDEILEGPPVTPLREAHGRS